MAGLVSALFVVGLVWFILRLISAAVLVMVDTAQHTQYLAHNRIRAF